MSLNRNRSEKCTTVPFKTDGHPGQKLVKEAAKTPLRTTMLFSTSDHVLPYVCMSVRLSKRIRGSSLNFRKIPVESNKDKDDFGTRKINKHKITKNKPFPKHGGENVIL